MADRARLSGRLVLLGQLFAAGRRSSGIDVEFGVLGALVGGAVAYLNQRYERQVNACRRAVRAEPALLPIELLALGLCSDPFDPFAATLDPHGLSDPRTRRNTDSR